MKTEDKNPEEILVKITKEYYAMKTAKSIDLDMIQAGVATPRLQQFMKTLGTLLSEQPFNVIKGDDTSMMEVNEIQQLAERAANFTLIKNIMTDFNKNHPDAIDNIVFAGNVAATEYVSDCDVACRDTAELLKNLMHICHIDTAE